MASRIHLPKRYLPFLRQAQTEGELRYAQPEQQLYSLLNSRTHQASQDLLASQTANQELIGSLRAGAGQLDQAYTQAGLDPATRAAIANSPTGQRIASELASGQQGLLGQLNGAEAGQVYQQQHIRDQLRQDVGQINDQANSMAREKALFEQNLLDQLISGDRQARARAKQALQEQNFKAQQNAADRTNSSLNTLLGQGLMATVGKDGQIQITGAIPGGKADPNAPGNRPKGPKATPAAQSKAESGFGRAVKNAAAMLSGNTPLGDVVSALSSGRAAKPGQPIFVTVKDPQTGKTHQQRKLNPDGTPATTGGQSAIPGVDEAIAQAAAEQAAKGYVTNATIRHLHHLGYRVLDFPGIVTETQYRRRPYRGPQGRTTPLAPGANGQQRPT